MEGVARARLQMLRPSWHFDSAGTGAWHEGEPPDARALRVASERGLDLSYLRARPLRTADYFNFDVILCADRTNLETARQRQPALASAQLALVLDWTGVQTGGEVPDPYYGELADFRRVHDLAEAVADALLAARARSEYISGHD